MNEKVLLTVSYSDETGKWYADSYIKNKVFTVVGSIHETVAKAIEENDNMTMSYKGKSQSNVFIDDKDGNAVPVGYIYRVKSEYMQDENGKSHTVFFTAWVEIKSVSVYPIENISL